MPEAVLQLDAAELRSSAGEVILAGVSGEVARGESLVIVGPSGAGKSRLLRLWNRLDELSAGRAYALGRPVDSWHPGELRRHVGWVPQRPHLGEGTARTALAVPQVLGLVASSELASRIDKALVIVDLDPGLLDRPLSRLSGGEQQRLAIARALTLAPEVLLLDEPTSALDGARAAAVLDALSAWAKERDATLVMVTHRIGDVTRLGGQMWVMGKGVISLRGPVAELAQHPEVRALMTGQAQAKEAS